jgi:acetyltransferase-like isoleucine patch superfamily enzyme
VNPDLCEAEAEMEAPAIPSGGGEISRSGLRRYQDTIVGSRRWVDLLRHECLVTCLAHLPGAMGLALRRRLYRGLFGSCGRGVTVGVGVALRQPPRIALGDGCVLDDLSRVAVKGEGAIRLGHRVLVGRGALVGVRGGDLEIGDDTSIGALAHVACTNGKARIGRHVMIAGYAYVGCCGHKMDRTDVPMQCQGPDSKGGVTVGDDVWIGTHAVVLDGVTVGRGAVIGACSLVTRDVPEYAIAFGVPAEVKRTRG